MSEVEEVVQVFKISVEGAEIFLKLGGDTLKFGGNILKGAKNFVCVIGNAVHKEKLAGKTKMRELLKKGGDLQVFKFPEEHKKKVEKLLKDYGILFASLPDLNKEDGFSEILFHAEATPRVNAVVEKLKMGQIVDIKDYIDNAEKDELEKQVEEYQEHTKETGEEPILSKEEKEEIEMRMSILAESPDKDNITIAKKLVAEETAEEFITRIPYEKKYLTIPKEKSIWINDGKTILSELQKEKQYHIADAYGKVVETLTGQEIYKRHYDPVSVEAKRRAIEKYKREKAKKKAVSVEKVARQRKQ